LILEKKQAKKKVHYFSGKKMQTTTCKKCGKFDLPIQLDKDIYYCFCPICQIKIKNPIPDDFENQSKLTAFFPIVPQKREVVKVIPLGKKFKQTKLK
jgi:hypothetical protein